MAKTDPTPAEIKTACARTQAGWTDETHARRLTIGGGPGIRETTVPRELVGWVEAYNAG